MKRMVNGIEYELTFKKIKNINLRITADGLVKVSSPHQIEVDFIDSFVASRRSFIENAKKKTAGKTPVPDIAAADEAVYAKLYQIMREVYTRFDRYSFRFPRLRIRKMKSQWGNCRKAQGIVTLNSYLYPLPKKYIEFVCAHELSHMVEANHSPRFYAVLESVMPDWRAREEALKGYRLVG